MCGIVGKLNLKDGIPVLEEDILSMMKQVEHRGPNDEGCYLDANLGLGQRRLSILDLSAAGHQPMSTGNKRYWITYNGEIYNYIELKKNLELSGHKFYSKTDTEVLLALFQREGNDCLLKLDGMFAFAIWDKQERSLFIARDPIGIKPLYYYIDDDKFLFASEIKAILASSEVPRKINIEGLHNFFAHGHSTAPITIYQRISKLQPGHYMVIRNNKIIVKQYWHPEPVSDHNKSVCIKEKSIELKSLLSRSVNSHLVSDVPLGVFLSGGLDSSAIVALMAQNGKNRIKTFTVGFDFGQRFNELDDARIVAKHFTTEHHELVLTENDLRDSIEKIVYYYDEPFGDPAAFPTYFVSRLARNSVTVCLSGEGVDELFGGYRRYLAEKYGSLFRLLPQILRCKIIPFLTTKIHRAGQLKRLIRTLNISDPVIRQGNWQMVFTDELRCDLFKLQQNSIFKNYDVYNSFRRHRTKACNDGLNSVLFADLRSWLTDCYLEKVDKASMAVGLEARVPFLDRKLVEFALKLPVDMKVKLDLLPNRRSLKRIFSSVLTDLLPRSILAKPKHGFAVPLDPWFRGKLSTFIFEVLFDKRTKQRGYFNISFIEKLFHEHKSGKEIRNNHLWLLVLFELWHRIYIDSKQ